MKSRHSRLNDKTTEIKNPKEVHSLGFFRHITFQNNRKIDKIVDNITI